MVVHSGRPKGVWHPAGNSGQALSLVSTLPWVPKGWEESSSSPTSLEITLPQEWAIFCPLEDHVIAGVCFLPHDHQTDCGMLLLRSGDWRYYSETKSMFDLLQQRVSSCVEYLHSICECSPPIYMYVSCCFDKNYKVRSERCMNVKPIWCTYLSISSALSI